MHMAHMNIQNYENKKEIINHLFESDEEFRKVLLDIRKVSLKQSSCMKKLRTKVRKELKDDNMLIHVSFLKDRLKALKSEIKQSEGYKEASSVERSYNAKVNKLFRQWGVHFHEVRYAIADTEEGKKHLPTSVFRMRVARILTKIRYYIGA
uniref:Uncharacterized protein n=1 Tax=viral metagenome TaxID=1070528 RepID=A0A6C0JVE7_9ZZZZ